jgi:hypothetical protein
VPRYLQGAQHVRVELLCREGDEHASAGELAEALACYMEAWELLPEPREEFADADAVLRGFTRVLRARGDLATGLEIMLGSRSRSAPAMARGLSRRRG